MGLPPSHSAADHNAWCVVNLLTESWCSTRQCAQWSSAAVAWYSSWRWCNCTVLHCYWPYDGWLAETLYVIVATHTHNRLMGEPVTETGFYCEQETVSGSGISWAICKSAPRCRQITTPAPHHSGFYRPDALPAAQPTASKHWRHKKAYVIMASARNISESDLYIFKLK